ncbi:MAG: hypothetical protein AAFR28_16165, partial [Pseudomonadota bacterium]
MNSVYFLGVHLLKNFQFLGWAHIMHAKAGAEGIWREREREIARTAKGYLLDWDGCCAVENKLLPGAAAFLSRQAKQCVIVSNNSTNTEGDFARIIARCGIQLDP